MNNLKPSISMAIAMLAMAACQPADETGTTAVALPDSITHIESVVRGAEDELAIPYEKFELENGLTILLHEDNSDPLVHVDVTYHVGSAREDVGKSGFAHFFEHMMFQGSENVGDEEHFRIVSESGGTLNGTTNTDRTNYFQTVPSNQLEKMLWLEADRMGFFLDAVTQEKFEVQRATVKNERAQRMDNQPYGQLIERVNEALYPEGHPYSWQTIGYVEDLDRVNVNDLKEFFLRWYGPNNAVLTIGGRFDKAQALEWVDKYFGSIPRGPEVAMPEKPVVTLDKDRYLSMEDNVALPLLYTAIPTVYLHHPDEAPLDVLMFILGQGETSLLYKNMVKPGFAVQAGANHGCGELSCTFSVLALPNPASGKSMADLEAIIAESLAEFEERGVLDDDLERVKTVLYAGGVYGLESVAGKVGQLALYETLTGDARYATEHIKRYEAVTKEDVMRVYDEYVKGQPRVVMSVVPRGQSGMVPREDDFPRPTRTLPEYTSVNEEDLEFRRGVDDFDRSVEPPAGGNPTVTLPEIWRASLENGIPVIGALNAETPTTALRIRIEAGQRHEPLDKLGLASLTAAMLNEQTTESTNEELSNALQKLGANVRFGAGNGETLVTIRSLSGTLDQTLAIAAEQLFKPKFDPQDFARVKAQTIESIRQSKTQPGVTADTVYQLLLYGKDNSFSHLNVGTEESVAAITLDDVREFYATHYSPKIASIVGVSDLPQQELIRELGVFAEWDGDAVAKPALEAFPELGGTRIYLVDNPGAAQSEIRIGMRSLTFDATGEYYRANLANFVLGGAFNSRINLNLREDKGYTYGARSSFSGNKEYGSFTARAGVRSDATGDSIVQFEDEIRKYADAGISETELTFTRRALGQRDARQYETPGQKVGFIAQLLEYDLDESFVDEQAEILAGIGKEEIDRVARELLTMDDMIIVVVGDKATVMPQLESLGYEIVEVDAAGEPLAAAG
ncbi:MAG: pitrilysin family protein [Woeseiaceae bacterium]|nr:pitrilysin family protein [Woeseiaceae bacterium]